MALKVRKGGCKYIIFPFFLFLKGVHFALEFLGENGHLTGVRVQPIDWKPASPSGDGKASGRPIMVEAGEPEVIKAELVLLAMGFLKPQHPEYPANVFLCGDAANGASLVVRAIASGLDTAKKVDAYLTQ